MGVIFRGVGGDPGAHGGRPARAARRAPGWRRRSGRACARRGAKRRRARSSTTMSVSPPCSRPGRRCRWWSPRTGRSAGPSGSPGRSGSRRCRRAGWACSARTRRSRPTRPPSWAGSSRRRRRAAGPASPCARRARRGSSASTAGRRRPASPSGPPCSGSSTSPPPKRMRRGSRRSCSADPRRSTRLSGLIEAAPFPMWHRGPDLKLVMVNGAYVAAVEGADAAAVVAQAIELIDEADGRSPLADAAQVRDQQQASYRTVPATVAGERRMMQVVEVPLGPNGVAGYAIDVEDQEQARGRIEPLRPRSARHARPAFGGRRAVRAGPQPDLLQSAVRAAVFADRRLPRRPPRVRPGHRRDARGGQSARSARFPRLEGGASALVHQRARGGRGGLAAARRQASARRRPAAARRRPAHHLRGPDRADPARLGARHSAAGPHRHLRQSVRGGRRVRVGRPAQPVEQPLQGIVGVRGGAARQPSARRCAGAASGGQAQARQPCRAGARAGAQRHGRAQAAVGARVDARRPRVRVRRGAAARRQRALHHARHFRQPQGRGGSARAQRGARGSRPAQDRLRLQHELRIAHAADLDRRLRRDARRRAMAANCRRRRANMSRRSSTASRGWAR